MDLCELLKIYMFQTKTWHCVVALMGTLTEVLTVDHIGNDDIHQSYSYTTRMTIDAAIRFHSHTRGQ